MTEGGVAAAAAAAAEPWLIPAPRVAVWPAVPCAIPAPNMVIPAPRVTAPAQKKRTPLHSAAYNGHAAVVEAWLAAGADTGARDVSRGGDNSDGRG